MTSPLSELDPVLNAPKRLAALAILHAAESADFGFLQERLDLGASDLSKQMSHLATAGYLTVAKSGRGPGATTTYAITAEGREAYRRQRRALENLLTPPPA